MTVRTHRGDYAPIGQFGWDGGAGTTTYADPDNQLVGILLTQTGCPLPDSAHCHPRFLDHPLPGHRRLTSRSCEERATNVVRRRTAE
ncbi:hypothetical protein [Nonomuraea dietziae]|uniref:hypothetical protein n=1 Tax=Nonomuraea dietziae TaxID=65515 RepID=UPI0031D74069